MELWLPHQIALNETSNALIEDVEQTARRVDDNRPLPPEIVARIEEELLGEQVYSSNAIEGNTLDLRETIMVLRHGVEGVRRKREAMEARNLGEAVKLATRWIDEKAEVYELERVLEAHRVILHEINDDWAGRIRSESVMIHGAKHQPPDHTLVPAMTERVMEYLRHCDDTNTVVKATWAHWALARIHPFYDGNGRIARLWQDLVLLKGRLTSAIIRPEDRRNYLDTLMSADDGDFNPLVQLVAQRIAATFDRYLVQLGRTVEFIDWVTQVAGEADERATERAMLEYQRWRRRMEQLRREFELCAARVSEASETVRIQVQPYPMIDQAQWHNIREGIGSSQTWFFKVDFVVQTKRLRYYFFFGKHFWTDLDDQRDRAENRVSLLISEDDGRGNGIRLDKLETCPLTVREVFVVDDRFVCRYCDASTQQDSFRYGRDVSALRIAQDFIREVVLNRLT